MDLGKIKQLMDLLEGSSLSEIEVRNGDESIRLARPAPGGDATSPVRPAVAAADVRGQPVRAPMAGTFYAASEPGADAFVAEDQPVTAGDVLCIIESMKMMNEIKADRSGVCVAVAVANGQPVAAGDVLFRIA